MAISVTKVTVTIDGTDYTADVSGGSASVDNLPTSVTGKTVTVKSVTQTGASGDLTITTSPATLKVPNSATVTVTDSTDPTPQTATFTLDTNLKAGYTMENTINKAGWFNFRRIDMTSAACTADGIVLPVPVAEVISVQCGAIAGYEFNKSANKLKVFTAAGTPKTSGTLDKISILAWIE